MLWEKTLSDGRFLEELEYLVLGDLFDRSQNQQKSATNPKAKRKRYQGRRARAAEQIGKQISKSGENVNQIH
jgi:hypothetical protein